MTCSINGRLSLRPLLVALLGALPSFAAYAGSSVAIDLGVGTQINASSDAEIGPTGQALMFSGGTLATTGAFPSDRGVNVDAVGSVIDVASGAGLVITGPVTGTGSLNKEGSGALSLNGSIDIGSLIVINGTLNLSGNLINLTGDDVFGINTASTAATTPGIADPGAGTVNANNVTVSGGPGALFSALEGGTVTVNGGTLSMTGIAAYAMYTSDGTLKLNNVNLTTSGANTDGVRVDDLGNATVNDSVINTNGDGTIGIEGFQTFSDRPFSLTFSGTDVQSIGDAAVGLYALDSNSQAIDGNPASEGHASFTSGSIVVTGHGVGGAIVSGASLELRDSSVTVAGDDSLGLEAVADGTIDVQGGTMSVQGANDIGIFVDASKASLAGTQVTVSGTGANLAQVNNGGILNLHDMHMVSTQGAGVVLAGDATVTLDNTTIQTAQETFVSELSAGTQTQTITVGNNSIATGNDGTLLRVDREQGAQGIVNLILATGSTASGDIKETNADLRGAGGTDVVIEQGAQWSGLAQGVRDFQVQQGGNVNFADGSSIYGDLNGQGAAFTFGQGGGAIGGNVTLNAGSVIQGGSVTTPIVATGSVTVDQTSLFGGNWTVRGSVTNDGTIRPGNSIGVINVNGNLVLGPNSIYAVEVNGAGESDRINVGGTAQLGGSVSVSPLGSYQVAKPYTILNASGGLGGTTFAAATIDADYAFLSPVLTYNGNDVLLTLNRSAAAFSSLARTHNQAAVAGALDRLPLGNALANAMAFTTTDTAPAAFNALSGEVSASMKTALIDDSRFVRDAMNDRLRDAFISVGPAGSPASLASQDSAAANHPAVWGKTFDSWGSYDGNGNAAHMDTSTGGFVMGVDGLVANRFRVGLLSGYSRTSMDLDNRASSGDSDNYHLGVYGGGEWGNLSFRSGFAYSWHDIQTRRSVILPGFSDAPRGSYDADTAQFFGELGYKIDTVLASFEPFANLAHVSLHTDGVRESGGPAALTVDGDTADNTFTTLGLRASQTFKMGSVIATARGKVGWNHTFGAATPTATQAFSSGDSFTVAGIPLARDSGVVEAGFDVNLTRAATLNINYEGEFASGIQDNSLNAQLRVQF